MSVVTLFVFILVFLSAALHVLWNTFVKKCKDKASFAWLTSIVGVMILLPVFVSCRLAWPGPLGGQVWGWAAFSGLFEAMYVVFLFSAYGRADLSVVYPLSRGIAPLVTWTLGGIFVGDSVSFKSGLAVGLIVAGVLGLSYSARNTSGRAAGLGVLLSLGTGCMIAGYHLVDRKAMSMAAAPSPLEYLFLMHLFLVFFITAWVCLAPKARRTIFSEWRSNRPGVLIVGFCTPLAYFLIILALRYGNVTYIAAGRNIGIFISVIVGVLFLKERVTRPRFAGALLIAAGVIGLVALGGT